MLFYVYFDRIGIIIQIFLFILYNIYNVFARQFCLAKFQNVIVYILWYGIPGIEKHRYAGFQSDSILYLCG